MYKLFLFFLGLSFFSSLVFSSHLVISEVFIDGTDEFVEISNLSDEDFVGTLLLSGAKSSTIQLQNFSLPAWSSFVLGDSLAMMSSFDAILYKTGFAFGISDSSALSLSLWSGESLIDAFDISADLVIGSDNAKSSFQKKFSGTDFTISLVDAMSTSLLTPYFGNPGQVYDIDNNFIVPRESPSLTIDCSVVSQEVFSIDEIYKGDGYGNYIEILVHQDWFGSLAFSGSSFSSPFSLPEQMRDKGTRYLVTNNASSFLHSGNIVVSSGLSLSTGLILLSSSAGDLFDVVLLDDIGQSIYKSEDYNCVHSFASNASPSPGFDQSFLSYLNTQTIVDTVILTGEVLSGACDVSTGGISSSGTVLDTLSNYLPGDIFISMIDYDPVWSDTNNERIGLTSLSGDIHLSGLSLLYDGKKYSFTTGSVFSGQETIITGNFSFVNSRVVCVALYQSNTLLDTVCYDPSQDSSPFLPLSFQNGSISGQILTGQQDEEFDYNSLQFDIRSLIYDPDGSDTDTESVLIYFSGGAEELVLDNFRLRVGTTNKRIYGSISSGEAKNLVGNFQMPNTRATCVALTYNEIVYDEYCYNPLSTISSSSSYYPPIVPSFLYTNRAISIVDLQYDVEGSDTDRETITLLMTGNQEQVDLSKLYLRFASTKHKLSSYLLPNQEIVITGNFQMPNSKATCIDLMEGDHIFDTYCYDPASLQALGEKDIATVEEEKTSTPKELKPQEKVSKKEQSDSIDRVAYYSGMKIDYLLPNPKGKDIKNDNEIIALSWWGGSGQTIENKHIYLLVGKSKVFLSGMNFTDNTLVFASPISLVNKPACARIFVEDYELDRLCYPQAEEDMVYYHEGTDGANFTLPSSLIDMLDNQNVDLSALLLKRSGTQICLVYDTVSIRCMSGGTTKTSLKNKKLTTLGNAYIRQISTLVSSKDIAPRTLDSRSRSYQDLSKLIKQGKTTTKIRDHVIPLTDVSAYRTLVYERKEQHLVADALMHNFLGSNL